MAFIAGKGYKAKINSVEVGTYLTNVGFPLTKDALETTTMGDSARDYIEGLKGATISLSGRWDPASGNLDDTLYTAWNTNTVVAFKLNPTGVASGASFTTSAPGYTGNMWVTNYEHTAPFDGVVSFSATLQVSGTVTRDTSGTY
jgi:predicted secreted protein